MVVIKNPAPDRYNGVVANADHVVTGFIPKGPHHSVVAFRRHSGREQERVRVATSRQHADRNRQRRVPADDRRPPARMRIFPLVGEDAATFYDVGTRRKTWRQRAAPLGTSCRWLTFRNRFRITSPATMASTRPGSCCAHRRRVGSAVLPHPPCRTPRRSCSGSTRSRFDFDTLPFGGTSPSS